jgi:hypothetical protein
MQDRSAHGARRMNTCTPTYARTLAGYGDLPAPAAALGRKKDRDGVSRPERVRFERGTQADDKTRERDYQPFPSLHNSD